MPLDDLLDALQRDATGEAQRILEEAEREAASISAASDDAYTRRRNDYLTERAREFHLEANAEIGMARRRAQEGLLTARSNVLERVFAAAYQQLPEAIRSDAYRAALPSHVSEMLKYFGDGKVVVTCPPVLEGDVRTTLSGHDNVELQTADPKSSGVSAYSADGSLTVDNTLEARIRQLQDVLQIEIARRIEGNECHPIGETLSHERGG